MFLPEPVFPGPVPVQHILKRVAECSAFYPPSKELDMTCSWPANHLVVNGLRDWL